MNENRIATFLTSLALSFCIALGSIGCLASAYELMPENTSLSVFFCLAASLIFSAIFLLRRPYIPAVLLFFFSLIAIGFNGLSGSLNMLLHELTQTYHIAYGWPITALASQNAHNSPDAALLVSALFISTFSARTICRGGRIWLALLFALFPLIPCFIVTDKVPSEGYIFLFSTGLLLLILSQTLRRKNAARGSIQALYLSAPVIFALLLFFSAFPRAEYTGQDRAEAAAVALFGWEARSPVYSSRLSASINLLDVTGTGKNTHSILTVSSSLSDPLYLRAAAYDIYTGTSWEISEGSWALDNESDWTQGTNFVTAGYVDISTPLAHSVLYLPSPLGESSGINMQQGRVNNSEKAKNYSLPIAEAPAYNATWNYLPANNAGAEQYLQLPTSTKREAEILLGLEDIPILPSTASAADIYKTALEIGIFVRDRAEYDKNTAEAPDSCKDFAIWFLNGADSGICTHYATAATVLLRAANIPARYVTGYIVSQPGAPGCNVSSEDAYAWVEYYLPYIGWMILDATPPFAQDLQPLNADETSVDLTPDIPESTQPEPVPTPTPTPSAAPSQRPKDDKPENPGQSTQIKKSSAPLVTLGISLILILTAAAIYLQYRLRLRRRILRANSGSSNSQLLNRWVYAEQLAARLGETPPAALLVIAKKAKYSQHNISIEELSAMQSYLDSIIERQKELSFLSRLSAKFLLALL